MSTTQTQASDTEVQTPEYIGSRAVADMLGIGLGKLFGMRKRDEFPKPDLELGNRPLWKPETIQHVVEAAVEANVANLRKALEQLPEDKRTEVIAGLSEGNKPAGGRRGR